MSTRNSGTATMLRLAIAELALTSIVVMCVYVFWPDDRAASLWFIYIWIVGQIVFLFLLKALFHLRKAESLLRSINKKAEKL